MRQTATRAHVEPRLVSLDKAAAYVDTSTRTIRRAIAEGRLRGYRFGPGLLRVDLNEIDAVLGRIPTAGMS